MASAVPLPACPAPLPHSHSSTLMVCSGRPHSLSARALACHPCVSASAPGSGCFCMSARSRALSAASGTLTPGCACSASSADGTPTTSEQSCCPGWAPTQQVPAQRPPMPWVQCAVSASSSAGAGAGQAAVWSAAAVPPDHAGQAAAAAGAEPVTVTRSAQVNALTRLSSCAAVGSPAASTRRASSQNLHAAQNNPLTLEGPKRLCPPTPLHMENHADQGCHA